MRAFVLKRYGGPKTAELRDMPKPRPGRGEVLIRIHAAGLNPVDFKTRQGQLRMVQRYRLPIIMGNELAGIVEERGAGSTLFAEGDRVFARMPKATMGAFADYAVLPESHVARMPATLDFATAAGVPLAGLTALQALSDELRVGPGSRVFIPGGAGGVGTFAIQLAKWLGADVIIDYTAERFEDRLRDMDGVFDLLGGETLQKSFGVVKAGGKVVSIAGMPEPETARKDLDRGIMLTALFWLASYRLRTAAREHDVTYRYLFMHPSGAELAELARLIDDGRLKPIIDRVVAFDQIEEAFAYLEAGRAKGKVVVRMAEDE